MGLLGTSLSLRSAGTSEFQNSQRYIVRSCLKRTSTKNFSCNILYREKQQQPLLGDSGISFGEDTIFVFSFRPWAQSFSTSYRCHLQNLKERTSECFPCAWPLQCRRSSSLPSPHSIPRGGHQHPITDLLLHLTLSANHQTPFPFQQDSTPSSSLST